VVNASHQHQQHAAAVRQAEVKLRVPVQHAAENKVAGAMAVSKGKLSMFER